MSEQTDTLEVVAGIVHCDGRLLVCQRKRQGPFPLKWEFPGGKVEKGEDAQGALARELKEELAIEIYSAVEIFHHRHRYPNGLKVSLRFFRVDRYEGEPTNQSFHRICWIEPPKLGELDFLEGNWPLIERIMQDGLEG